MFNFKQIKIFCCVILISQNIQASELLTLDKVEKTAYRESSLAKKFISTSQSYSESSVAAGKYADPKINFGLFNLPNDDFSFTKNSTTQLRLGIKQMLPRGSILGYKSEEKLKQSQIELFKSKTVLREVLKQSRLTYLDLFKEVKVLESLNENKKNFKQLVQICEQKFSNGLASQQDIINAKLQLAKLDDRILNAESMIEQHKSKLSQWVGNLAWETLSADFPDLYLEPNYESWSNHPLMLQASEVISTLETKLEIQQEMKKSAWSVGFEYRKRFGNNPDLTDRSDMLAMIASIELPYFSRTKQDKLVSSVQFQIEAAEHGRLNLKNKLSSYYSIQKNQLNSNHDRLSLYESEILKISKENKRAAMLAYQNGKSDFSALLTAEISVLETTIKIINLKIEVLKAKAKLLYLVETQEQILIKYQNQSENM